MISDEKNLWREKWLVCLNELTSLDLQKKSWLDKTNTNPHWSFIEFMCSYFDDLGIEDNYKYPLEKGWLTDQEFEIVKEWHYELDKYNSSNNDDYNHDAILKDPEWLNILQSGQKMNCKLISILNEIEKKLLTKELNIV